MTKAGGHMKFDAPSPVHEPLSQSFARLLAGAGGTDLLTTNQLLERTEGRGLAFVFILLSLPFVAWVSVPGMSTVFGSVIALLAVRLALNLPPRLPAFLGHRALSPKSRQAILTGGLKFCRVLERFVRPRRTVWMSWRITQLSHALLIVILALLLALPLPSPPFFGSNALPSYAIILLAVSMMEEDGVMIFFAYGASLVAMAYFVLSWELVTHHLTEWWGILLRLVERAG